MDEKNKQLNGFVLSSLLVFSVVLLVAGSVFGETKVFVEEYTYQASKLDNRLSSRVIAFEQVKRLLSGKLGIYLKGETEVKNIQLTKDQIVIMTAGIVRAEIIDEKWNGKTYYLKAEILADPKEVIKSIGLLRQDRRKTKELEETRKKTDEALREIERLKKALEISKAGKAEQDQYKKAIDGLRGTDWFEKGLALAGIGEWQGAREAFTRAIELDPNDAMAYFERGIVCGNLGNQQQKIRDLDKAIELEPNDAAAYVNRGIAYANLGNHRQEIADYDRAIEMDPKYAMAYYNRGVAYFIRGDYRQAISDWDEAIELDPKLALAHYKRGVAYAILREYRQAISDWDEAIALDPNDALSYYARGLTYGKLGDDQQKIEDFRSAARLGNMEAQDYLRSREIRW